ncbi:MAG: alpha/beta hydrolase [Alphaproteobacteria bacterium]|nr:alpha/beta hydrolase [Alphaproteobacteria bacterium]
MKPAFLTLGDGSRIAYHSSDGEGPRVVFCCGYRSDMNATKATALAEWCAANRVPLTRFDYFAHGQSGGDFMDFTIGSAMQSALEVIDRTASESIILIGSSMGAWVALNAARERKAVVRGLIGVAPAPDFTERLLFARLSPERRQELDENGLFWAYSEMSEADYPVTRHFIEEARNHLMLDDVIGLDIPVHLLHGQEDVDVPWEHSLLLARQLLGDEVTVTLIKDGDHRLNRPADLQVMTDALARMLASAA